MTGFQFFDKLPDMKLSQWAKEKGISYKTAYRMFQAGMLPVKTEQLPTGTILVFPDEIATAYKVTMDQRVDEIFGLLTEIKAILLERNTHDDSTRL